MDAGSIIGVLGVIAQAIENLYAYGSAVKKYPSEVACLRSELFGLQAALKQVSNNLGHGQSTIVFNESALPSVIDPSALVPTELASSNPSAMLVETQAVLRDLNAKLTSRPYHKSRLGIDRILWPSKRGGILTLVAHLERLKTYFIMAATSNTLFATINVTNVVEGVQSSITQIQDADKRRLFRAEVEPWLSPCQPAALHEAAFSSRIEDTNSWFLNSTFQEWTRRDSGLLWLRGEPGSGKTCMMAACIERAATLMPATKIGFFYCSYNDEALQNPANVLGSVIAQLCDQDEAIRDRILQAFRETQKIGLMTSDSANVKTLTKLLHALCEQTSDRILIFVDAVNECGDATSQTVKMLVDFTSNHANVSLMLIGTEDLELSWPEASVGPGHTMIEASMDLSRVEEDIRTYVDFRLAQDPRLQVIPHPQQQQITSAIQSQSHGSFRWAQCTLDNLTRMTTTKAITKALTHIPPTLENLYNSVLCAVPEDAFGMIQTMLECIVASLRPLKLSELSEVVAFASSDKFSPDDRLITPETLIRHLRSLVRFQPATQEIELAHSSVRDFLTCDHPTIQRRCSFRPLQASETMTRLCISYLSLPVFQKTCKDNEALLHRKRQWPFYEYASFFWTRHARSAYRMHDKTRSAIADFVHTADQQDGGNYAAWYQCVYPQGFPSVWQSNPLYMCAREGLVHLIRIILSSDGRNLLEKRGGSRGSTPLHVAATYNEKEAVRVLLDAGADPNERNQVGESGIQWAFFYGWTDVVRMLTDAGADANLLDPDKARQTFERMQKHYSVPSVRHSSTDSDVQIHDTVKNRKSDKTSDANWFDLVTTGLPPTPSDLCRSVPVASPTVGNQQIRGSSMRTAAKATSKRGL